MCGCREEAKVITQQWKTSERKYEVVVERDIRDHHAPQDVEHVMKGYRADSYSQIETLVFMAYS